MHAHTCCVVKAEKLLAVLIIKLHVDFTRKIMHFDGFCILDRSAVVCSMYLQCFVAGSLTFHNLTVKGADIPGPYEGYAGNYIPAHAHPVAAEATPSGSEVSRVSSLHDFKSYPVIYFIWQQ